MTSTAATEPSATQPALAARPRRWKIGLALTAIFVCGVLVGGLGTLRLLQDGVGRRVDPARWAERVMHQYDARLRLTPTQRERITPLVRAGAEEARAARQRAFGEARGIIARTHAQIAAELDDRQRGEFERLLAERRGRGRRWLGPIRRGDGPPPLPPPPAPMMAVPPTP